MKEHKIARWKQFRKVGRQPFIIRYGVIGFGVTLAVLLSLFEWLSQQQINISLLIVRFMLFPVIGFLLGIAYWDAQERKYMDKDPS